MSTHRITIELSDDCYRLLRQAIEAGDYASESEAVGPLLAEREMTREADAKVHPELLLMGQQTWEFLERQRTGRSKSSHAA